MQKQVIFNFDYNPSLLQELMKIMFSKCTTETTYLDPYIRLCVGLFKKFDDAEHTEMNFKKLLLNRCQKQFYKMLQREQTQRRVRRASMEEKYLLNNDLSQDFSKQMMAVFDEDELKLRQRDQMHGNMKLIVELFKLEMISGNIVKTCLDELFEELSAHNIEVLCSMLDTLVSHLVVTSRQQRLNETKPGAEAAAPKKVVEEKPLTPRSGTQRKYLPKAEARKQSRAKANQISLEYLDTCLQAMFRERPNRCIESRVRFKIQDLIDKFERDWKHEIFFMRRNDVDSEGFQKKYVPKGSRLAQEAHMMSRLSSHSRRSRKDSHISTGVEETKQPPVMQPTETPAQKPKSLYMLMQSLAPPEDENKKAEESQSDDEDAMALVGRRISMNVDNVVGLDFERYKKMSQSPQVRLKIENLFLEYKEGGDK